MSERYELKSLFARGGMAEVYLGVAQGAEGFEKPVAIKRILPHLAADPRIAKMFTAEAKLASYLHHQNIVQTLDVGQGPDGLYIVMELVRGWDLGVLMDCLTAQQKTFPPPLVAYIGIQVLAGLSHAFRKTVEGKRLIVAHRDISPSNVLVSVEGEVKVADFGIARLDAISSHGTEPGTFKGKVAYAAPEMLSAQPATSLSDQFSLGIVLHEMLTGTHPFGNADDLTQYITQLHRDAQLPMTGVPPPLADVVRKLLAKSPGDRFESIEAASKALGLYLAQAHVPASSTELAEFVESCHPPTPLVDGAGNAPTETRGSDTLIRAAFSLHGNTPPANQINALMHEVIDPDWKPLGAVMDSEGRIDRSSTADTIPHGKVPNGGGRRGPPTSVDEPLELAMPVPVKRVTYDEHGNEIVDASAVPPRPNDDTEDPVAGVNIVRSGYRVKPKTSKAPWVALAAGVLMVAGAAGALLYGPEPIRKSELGMLSRSLAAKLPFELPKPSPPPGSTVERTAVLQINSDPEGAIILINGTEVGITPLLTENTYPLKNIPVMLELRGYKTWKGEFQGARDAEVQATLKKK